MKILVVFASGHRQIGDNLGMVLSENPSTITKRYNLSLATDEEIASLTTNPQNDELLQQIEKRTTI